MNLPDKRYSIIYADPPWFYNKRKEKSRTLSAQNHYSVMELEDICKLPVGNIADDNSILFLWTTFPHLEQAFKVINAWGFTYKTNGFTWVKENKDHSIYMGMGYYTRSNAEICLLATKGSVKRISAFVKQVVIEPKRRHSQKPDVVRDRIVELCGDMPRIELFARERFEGWDAWGNEIGE